MANENQNPLFAYVESRISAWQAVLASLKAALSLDPSGKAGEGLDLSLIAGGPTNGDTGQPVDLPDGAFFGKSVPACVKLYLSAARKKKTSKEITAALKEGGVESTGDFYNVVTTALARLRLAGEVLKFKDGWGLSEWYPSSMRTNGSAGKPQAKSKKKGRKAKTKAATALAVIRSTPEAKRVTVVSTPDDKPEVRILGFFENNRREVLAREVADALGMKIQTVCLVLSKLAHKNKIKKLDSGSFKALEEAS